ncbi:MAG TPA: DUF433 domain-containing protein [Micromonosporaceae bacterium]
MASVLEREMFSEAAAAQLLRVPQSTLHYWLEGSTRGERRYRPIIRIEPKNTRTVTWAEFVEATLLRGYRRERGVPMAELRKFVDLLRDEFGVPYPLADRRPYASGRALVYDAQTAAGLDAEFCLVAVANDQLMLTPASQSFMERIEWKGNEPTAWRPIAAEEKSPVRVDPDKRFGRPSIKGISTEILWEEEDAGEDVEVIAETYNLDVADVRWALAYENSLRAA